MPDPDRDRARYHGLTESDFAIFAMQGAECQPLPKSIAMVLITQLDSCDAEPFARLNSAMAGRQMIALTPESLSALRAASSADHPLRQFQQFGGMS